MSEEKEMAEVIAFPIAPRTARTRATDHGTDGADRQADVLLFTGVRYERTDCGDDDREPPQASRRRRRG